MCTLMSAVVPGSGTGGSTVMRAVGGLALWQPRQPPLAMPLALAHTSADQPESTTITVMNCRRCKTSSTFLGALGFGLGLRLRSRGHLLDPIQTLLLGQPPFGDVEGEGGGLGGIILFIGQPATLVRLGH